ncbi:MAG TPA: thiamine pyrophosphate-dependent enzyme, partial [Opitutaceae bacterium]|nr:thiamine pyrophosphate-dependent enzyme [Opitutaceae bacterium]
RHHAGGEAMIITAYDAILRNARAARELMPDQVICFGGWPTSKVLRGWLEQAQAGTLMISPGPANRDSLHGRTRYLSLSAEDFTVTGAPAADPAYAIQWSQAETAARGCLDGVLGPMDELFEGRAAWLLAQHLPAETPLFVASSMPVRDAEYFWPANDRRCELFFNRGANGIDGTLSTALGVAQGSEHPAVLLTGDLALLHDTNGFLLRPKLRGSLTIVLINNRGGGIFEHLPAAQFDPPFEEFFATPQEAEFAQLCPAYGVAHVMVRDWKHFTGLISVLPANGVRVLEVRTDRKRDAATRKKLFAETAAAVEKAFLERPTSNAQHPTSKD